MIQRSYPYEVFATREMDRRLSARGHKGAPENRCSEGNGSGHHPVAVTGHPVAARRGIFATSPWPLSVNTS
jgi:hypothetical protein